jgi:hypothetical protein
VLVEHYTVVFGDRPLHPDQEREVRLRRVALDLEASDALDEFAAALDAP